MAVIRSADWRHAAQILLLSTAVIVAAACTSTAPRAPHRATGTIYYVSPSGNDAAAGTSPTTAWRTLHRASQVILRPGDRLLLQGGQQFPGQLIIGPGDADDADNPAVIGSYGSGAATVTSAGFAIYVHDTADLEITDLNLVGQPSGNNLAGQRASNGNGAGLNLYNDLPLGHRLNGIVINHVDVSGFDAGIALGGENPQAGFGNVQVSHCTLTGNVNAGLETYGPQFDQHSPSYTNQNVKVTNVVAAGNRGNPHDTTHNTGNGIVLGSVQDGIISWSTADHNGGAGGATTEGPEGIWAFDSTGIVIQHNLAYDNKSAYQVDGNGFGLDQNTTNSVLQDNLSYGNAGTGYLLYSNASNGTQKNDVVRHNISSADSRDGGKYYGGITIFGAVSAANVYQNTVVMTSSSGPAAPALRLGTGIQGITVRNNIFATNFSPVVAATQALSPAMASLQGNDYFSANGPWSIGWGPTAYSSLASWRAATSQETAAGQNTGFTVNPDLTGPAQGLQTKLATGQPAAENGFVLHAGSPLLGKGIGAQ